LPGGGGVPSALCCRQRTRRTAASAMGGYELVRSDDAAGAPGPDLESGAGANSKAAPSPPTAAPRGQPRLVSLDVFRGITVLVRAHMIYSIPTASAEYTELNSRFASGCGRTPATASITVSPPPPSSSAAALSFSPIHRGAPANREPIHHVSGLSS
jgi:hypothetical protein